MSEKLKPRPIGKLLEILGDFHHEPSNPDPEKICSDCEEANVPLYWKQQSYEYDEWEAYCEDCLRAYGGMYLDLENEKTSDIAED